MSVSPQPLLSKISSQKKFAPASRFWASQRADQTTNRVAKKQLHTVCGANRAILILRNRAASVGRWYGITAANFLSRKANKRKQRERRVRLFQTLASENGLQQSKSPNQRCFRQEFQMLHFAYNTGRKQKYGFERQIENIYTKKR